MSTSRVIAEAPVHENHSRWLTEAAMAWHIPVKVEQARESSKKPEWIRVQGPVTPGTLLQDGTHFCAKNQSARRVCEASCPNAPAEMLAGTYLRLIAGR